MMRRHSFGFIVDHPQRDLPGAVSFARALTQRGCDTYLIPLYDQATDVPLLPLDAVVVNFARPANLDLAQGYRDAALPVFVIDTEGGNQTEAGTNTPDRLATLLDERGFSKLLSGYFFWGPRLREAFAGRCGMPADALITTGCPRFDYASPRWRPALTYPLRDYVLINANYPLVNPLFVSSESRERAAAVEAGWNGAYVASLVEDMTSVFQAFQETVSRLAGDLPQIQFLVRPHPFENSAVYRRRFAALSNIRVDATGSVLNVIANARCLLHLNCATAVEATMLDRLPISVEYLNTSRLLGHAPLPSRISAHAQSYEQLIDMVRNPEAHARVFPFEKNYRDTIYPWFYENDGCAADRMVEALLARVSVRKRPVSIAQSVGGSRRAPRPGQRLQSVAGNLIGSFATSRLRSALQPARRGKGFSPQEITIALERLCTLEKIAMPTVVRARHPATGLPLASVVCRAA